MDTLEFFQRILPPSGVTYLVLFPKDKPYKLHKAFTDLEDMAEACARFNNNPQYTHVYHACSAYAQPFVSVEVNGKTKKKYRIDQNWHKAKSFWIDLDCGEDKAAQGKGYLKKFDALKALDSFSAAIGWPKAMVVDSGAGLHCYWPLTKAIGSVNWSKLASGLKVAAAHFGLLQDPTRTADFASILRPVGSLNRKREEHKTVNVKRDCPDSDPLTLAESLKAYITANDVKRLPDRAPVSDLNSDLTAHLAMPSVPADGNLVADACAQLRLMRETGSPGSYEHWRLSIGILTHCEGGRELAHQWSAGASDYDADGVDMRYDTWNAGPTTCASFESINAEGCVGCPSKDKVKTPLMLGRVIPIVEERVEEVVLEDKVQTVTIPALPHGYQWDKGIMSRLLADKDGIIQAHGFCSQLFYPYMRIRNEDATYKIGMRMHMHDSKVREFQMPFEAMSSQSDLLRALARYELMQTNHKEAGVHLTAYLRDQLEDLKRKVEETGTMTTFGWKDELRGFLLGDRYYSADGSVRRVLLGGYAAAKASTLPPPTGSVAGYAKPLNHVYNRPGMECMQYALASGWGSILAPFCEELYCGLLVALTGGDSGKGKSTVTYASLYAFGDSNAMALKSDEAGTRNALWATVGAYNNVPLVFDELTKIDPEEFSKFAYTMSLGEEKARLQSTGNGIKFANQSTWRMSAFVTANKDLHGVLAATQANSQAEAVRLIQIHVDRYDIPQLEETEVQTALAQMKLNRGCAGEALIQYCVTHTAELFDMIREKVAELVKFIPGTKYRFYRNHAACTLVAAELAVQLGICAFDVARMQAFAVQLMQDLAKDIAANNTVRSDDAFNRIVADLSPAIIVTAKYTDARGGAIESPRRHVSGPVVGRYVLGSDLDKTNAGWLLLSTRAVRGWCLKNRTDYNNVIASLREIGALVAEDSPQTMTKGTDVPRVQTGCLIVDTKKLDSGHLSIVDTVAGLEQKQA